MVMSRENIGTLLKRAWLFFQAKMPLKYWWEAFHTTVYLIHGCPLLRLMAKFPSLCCTMILLNMMNSECSDLLAFHVLDPTNLTSLIFILRNVYFWGTVAVIKGIGALVHLEEFIPYNMCASMKKISLSPQAFSRHQFLLIMNPFLYCLGCLFTHLQQHFP